MKSPTASHWQQASSSIDRIHFALKGRLTRLISCSRGGECAWLQGWRAKSTVRVKDQPAGGH